jgi:hypothetical protein
MLSLSLSRSISDIHKKTWHAKHDLSSANNDLTLRALSETNGGNNDTTDQLRQRLVRMSLRQREIVFAQQQREADLLSKLRTCSNYLQMSLNFLNSSSEAQEKKLFKVQVTKFLNETIALGSEDTESSSAESHDEILLSTDFGSFENQFNGSLLNGSLLNHADSFISEYLAQQSLPTEPVADPVCVHALEKQPPPLLSSSSLTSVADNRSFGLSRVASDADLSSFRTRKRSHLEVDSEDLPDLMIPSVSSSSSAVHSPSHHPTSPPSSVNISFDYCTLSPTPSSITSTHSSFPSHSHTSALYSKFSYGLPPSMTIPQSCVGGGLPACSPTVSGHDVFDLMFSLTSEVNLPSTAIPAISAIPALHPPPQPPFHSVHNLPPSSTGPGLLSTSVAPAASTPHSDEQSNNIADVMAWIKNNPLKTTKRYT